MNRIEELLERLRAHAATPEDLAELKQRLSTPEGRAKARERLWMESALHSAFRAAPVLVILAKQSQPPTMADAVVARVSAPFQKSWARWAMAACFAFAALGMWAWLAWRPVAGLEAVHGTVTVLRGGKVITGVDAMTLLAGDMVRTAGGAGARVQWRRETTYVELQADAELRLAALKDDKHLALLSGTLTAEVAKQPPGHPMVLETRQGRVEVLGTRFELSTATDRTRVEVTSGRVLLAGLNQDNGSVVEACLAGEVDANGEVEVADLPVAETLGMGLLAHWPLDEGKGEVARDASGNGRDATLQNPAWTTNANRVALDFSGVLGLSPEKRSFLRTPELQLPQSFTITLWLRPEKTESVGHGVQVVFANTPYVNGAAGFQFFINRPVPITQRPLLSTDDQSFNFRVDDGQRRSTVSSRSQAFEPGRWYFLVVMVNQSAGRVAILVDGRDVGMHPSILKEFSLATPLFFGAPPGSSTQPSATLAGMLRDVRLYSRPLSEEEIQFLSQRNPQTK